MSLVSGLLTWKADVQRFTMVDDGQGGFTFGTPDVPATNLDFLKTSKRVAKTTPTGGVVFIEQTLGYMEYQPNSIVKEGDVLTNLRDQDGVVEREISNGVEAPTFYKVNGVTDPNGEHDHLELDLEKIRGRQAVQP